MPMRLAVVPARGGSKRIPDKNIRQFCGRPMIAHVLATARSSGLFQVIHVSTDSPRIAQVATDLGFTPHFQRPAELADDQTPLMPVLRYVASTFLRFGQTFDEIWLLMACAPLIDVEDLQQASDLFAAAGGNRPVISVAPYPAPPERAFELETDGGLLPVEPDMFGMRSQDFTEKYYHTGAYCIFPASHVLSSEGAGDPFGFVGHVAPRHKAIDIDNEDDWRMAEIVFRGTRRKR
jgi:pseudaminic acid cytidylyltransferase